jgi:membrane-bound lytic murein transglycosylase B
MPRAFSSAQTLTAGQRAQLEAQLAQVQAEEAQAQIALTAAKSKSSTLQNAINLIAAEIKTEKLDIQAKNLLIQTLGDNITTTQGHINTLDSQITQNSATVASMFRQLQQLEGPSGDTAFIQIILTGQTISNFLSDIINLQSLQQNLDTLSSQLALAKASSATAKQVLVTKQNAATDVLYTIQQEKNTLQQNENQQSRLLSLSKNNEKAYSSLVAEKRSEANAINAKLFSLAGGSNPIPFGQAYQYALSAQQKTGIDPAFLLAILTQESNLGSNQGNCYLSNETTGAGVSAKTGKVFTNLMNPRRDVPPFLQITSAFGIDPLHTVVSCPQSVGWGGAMGPAQFIPSTWMLFSTRVASALGFSGMANPWNPQHAFMASALYLTDLGAANGGYTAESNAACRYYSGSSCSTSALVASYGISVLSIASTIQTTEINKLQGL